MSGLGGGWGFGSFLLLAGAAPLKVEDVAEAAEVVLQIDTYALRGEGGVGEVAVGGLAVGFKADGALGRKQVTEVEVAHEVGAIGGSVAVAKVAVEEEAVVEEASLQQAVDLEVAPALHARRHVGTKRPSRLAAEGAADGVVELRGERGAQEGTHGGGRLLLRAVALADVGRGAGCVEATDAEQVDGLAVHVLLGGNELAHHLLFVVGDALQADVEVDLRRCCGASDVQYAVDLRRFATEARAVIEFAKRHAVDGVHGSQGQRSLLGIAGKGDAAAGCEGEVAAYDVLNAHFIGAALEGVGAVHAEGAFIIEGGAYGPAAPGRNVVACTGVGDDAHLGLRGGVDEEVEEDVALGGGRRGARGRLGCGLRVECSRPGGGREAVVHGAEAHHGIVGAYTACLALRIDERSACLGA